MNYPIQKNQQSTNQWRNSVLGYTSTSEDRVTQLVEKIKEDFKNNLDYFTITKNLDMSKTYDALIFDGNRDQKVLGYKQFLSYPYDTLQFDIGDYISFQYGDEYENWLITSLDKAKLWNVIGNIERCVSKLKWIDDSGKVKEYPCVIKDSTQRIMFPDFSSLLTTQKGYLKITVQDNSDTSTIRINDRFLFGISGNYTPFKVDLVNNFTKTKALTFDMYIDKTSPYDDLVNGIAWNDSSNTSDPPIPPMGKTNVISPVVDKILQGDTQEFSVFSYSDSVVQPDTFGITVSGVPIGYYTLTVTDGNHFKIQNNQMYSDSKLKITCTNNADLSVATMDVLLGGEF